MKHGRRDANQQEIVEALRKIGATVIDLADVGKDCPDILAGYQDKNFLIEIKIPTGKLTPGQAEFLIYWRGQVGIAKSIQDAFRIIGFIQNEN